MIENAPARQLAAAPGAPDETLVRQPRYFGICTRSSSWLAVSGWLRYLNLTASGTRSFRPSTRSGAASPSLHVRHRFDRRVRAHVPIRILPGRFRADDADGRALGVGAHDAERAGSDPDIDAAGDRGLHRLAAAAGEQQLEIEAVLAENAGALAQRGRGSVPDFALADRDLERVGGRYRCRQRGRGAAANTIRAAACNMARLLRSRRHSCMARLGSKLTPGGAKGESAPACRAPNPIETIGSDRGVGAERQGHPVDAVA